MKEKIRKGSFNFFPTKWQCHLPEDRKKVGGG